jgi:hypothetical protein
LIGQTELKVPSHSCTITGFVGWYSDQWLSTTLDQNMAFLIVLWQNTELGVCKKHLMYNILSSFRKLHHSFRSWVLQHFKFVMVINNKRFQNLFKFQVEIMDPCLYFFEYSPDVLKKKTKVLDIFNTDKKCFMKINIETSPLEIWIRIRFLEINGSPSLNIIQK